MEPTIEERPDTSTEQLPPFDGGIERTDEGEAAPPAETAAPDTPDEAPPQPTEAQVHALAAQLGDQARQYDGAAEAERRAESDGDDIFSGPYDPVEALKAITEINREVIAAKAEWEQSKEETKSLSDAYKEAAGRLCRVVARYDSLRKRSTETGQPFLRTVEDETIEHRRRRLAPALAARGLHVTAEQLEPLTREDLDTLERWLTTPGPIPPQVVADKAHSVGAPGENGQHCTKCGAVIPRPDDTTLYEPGTFFGLDCMGVDLSGETVRAPRTKKAKKRAADPESERKAQQEAGVAHADSKSGDDVAGAGE